MQHATQVELVHRVFDFYDRKSSSMGEAIYRNPTSDYTCSAQAELEHQELFRNYPLVVSLSCQIRNPGDYMTDDLSGVPILVVRTETGAAKAFLNVCRHRGARVARGCGSGKKLFVCPYHAWTYDLEGRLKNVAPANCFPNLSPRDHGLVPLPTVEKYGLIWVRPTPGADFDPDDLLDGLGLELAAYKFETASHYRTSHLHKDMNWKLIIDTFLETWHIGTLHRKTVAPIFQPNINVFDAYGRNGRFILPRRNILDLRGTPENGWDLLKHSAVIYLLFPNTLVIWQGDHVETWRSFPAGSTGQCTAEAVLYSPEPAVTELAIRHWDKNMDLLLATVEDEDFPVGVDIQRGFQANAQSYVTFGRNEPGLSHYHGTMRSLLGLQQAEPATTSA
jgi:phenylpropionate dioxygenase-like ring-hydroxylating dioxygenase large terminal subunit